MNCNFVRQYDCTWMCVRCMYHYDREREKPPKRNCKGTPNAEEEARIAVCGCKKAKVIPGGEVHAH